MGAVVRGSGLELPSQQAGLPTGRSVSLLTPSLPVSLLAFRSPESSSVIGLVGVGWDQRLALHPGRTLGPKGQLHRCSWCCCCHCYHVIAIMIDTQLCGGLGLGEKRVIWL